MYQRPLEISLFLIMQYIYIFRYTSRADENLTYAIVLEWPKVDALILGRPIPGVETTVTLLGLDIKFSWTRLTEEAGVVISIPPLSVSELPCQWAWIFRMSNLQ